MSRLEIVRYESKYDNGMVEINPILALSVRYHGDTFQDTVLVAKSGEDVVGFGFLSAGPTFLDMEHCDICHVHVEFTAERGHKLEVEASGALLEALIEAFHKMEKKYPEKKLVLRTWCRASATHYLEFLMQYEFMIKRSTPVMVRNLEDMSDLSEDYRLPKGLCIREIAFDEAKMKQYIAASGKAYVVPDSPSELWFRLGGGQTRVFSVMKDDAFVASITVWPVSEYRYATENIFCIPEYQRKGIASSLLRFALHKVKEMGGTEASLMVFGDNTPAQLCYLNLGYEVEDIMLEMHYETRPEFLLY